MSLILENVCFAKITQRLARLSEVTVFVGILFMVVMHTISCSSGGWDGTVHLNSGEVYEPDIDHWSFIAPASTARWDAGIAVESDKIYIVGGCDRNALCTLETECYDPDKNKWSKVASLPVATHGIKCCTIQLPHKFS